MKLEFMFAHIHSFITTLLDNSKGRYVRLAFVSVWDLYTLFGCVKIALEWAAVGSRKPQVNLGCYSIEFARRFKVPLH